MISFKRVFAILGVVLAIALASSLPEGPALAFDGQSTDASINAGEAILKTCGGIREERERIDCVSRALQAAAANIHERGPGYQYIRRTLEQASREVHSSKTKAQAAASIDKATATLKTAAQKPLNYAGPKKTAEKHFARFAQFTSKARSVLRS
ncbi:MAG: hypothetical protein KDJ36_15105 [Hyphomicrobiaceae bacterium]|nr:hypothetical protein [Acidimicrobiales bacterium]MCB1512227.1 hypothetical protein [Hyphomicrobiaceae bacterium]